MERSSAVAQRNPVVIEPRASWRIVDLAELWRYRDLLWVLAERDLRVRYKQTVVGVAWAILQPLSTVLVFSVFFHLLGRQPVASGAPYAVSLFCALLPWQLFAGALTQSSESLIANQNLITKVYFPRLLAPASCIVVCLADFGCSLLVLGGLFLWYGIVPGWAALCVPAFVGLACLAALAIGVWLSAFSALYRDFRYVVPFCIQIGFFVSPVLFETAALIPAEWRFLYGLNPMVGVIEGFRWALLGAPFPDGGMLGLSLAATLVLLAGGLVYFRRMERHFADTI